MCGICGMVSLKGSFDEGAEQMVRSAVDTLKKRGPQVQAVLRHEQVVLGHSRLSIIDTSAAANQPFTDESGRCTIVFNGEIYNYKALRNQLAAGGMSFHTESDTEVLLKWLMVKGAEGISTLQGFFAFAFLDRQSGEVLIARDRFGIKPLLYYEDGRKFVFASEMKALQKLGISQQLDPVSMQIYFQLNYIPGPWSIYENVRKLEPGHYITIRNRKINSTRYYKIPERPMPEYDSLSYEKAQLLLAEKLEAAVVKRLIADVPLGAFLSGGIDSSVIVALAAQHVKGLKTFSIGFKDEPMFDETRYARSVAQMHQTDHTEFSLTTSDLLDCMMDVLDYTDEPFADSSALAVYILSRETRGKVTVALSGDGADEMLAGYNKHMAHHRATKGGLGAQILKYMHPLLSRMPQSRNTFIGNKFRQLHRFSEGMKMSDIERYWRWAALADEPFVADLLVRSPQRENYEERKKKLTRFIGNGSNINKVLHNDMHLLLTNDMLHKVDMMSMANSLEVRVPFLDHDVVNLVFSMPEHFKIDAKGRKKILRDAFRKVLPSELYQRPKQGFEVPLLPWFRKELKQTILTQWLDHEFIVEQGLFNPTAIKKLKNKLFSANPGDVHAQIWSIGVFQHWFINNHDKK